MGTEACPICGEPADDEELDPHGHFSTDDDDQPEDDAVHLYRSGPRGDRTVCGAELGNASPDESDVTCPECRSRM